jgi:hypothetical protein
MIGRRAEVALFPGLELDVGAEEERAVELAGAKGKAESDIDSNADG